jgi:hypothetical protein
MTLPAKTQLAIFHSILMLHPPHSTWREWRYTDTKCEWIGSMQDALSCAFRAPLTLLYDATTDVDHRSFDSLVQWTYDIIDFEGGAWPEPDHRIHASS